MQITVQVKRYQCDFKLLTVEAKEAKKKAVKLAKEEPERFCDGYITSYMTVIVK